MKQLKLLIENSIEGLAGQNNSARWVAPGQKRNVNIEQLSGYTQMEFPVADELDISNEKYNWIGSMERKSKKYHNKVRAIRKEDGMLVFERQMKKLIDKIDVVDKLFESDYSDTYFDSFTDAAEYVRRYTKKKGFEIDEDDWMSKVALGGRYTRSRPSVGKTHSFTVGLSKNGKPQRKALHFQVYGLKSGKYELNLYIQ